jgi:transcription initiation factor TFIID subunit 8
MCANHSINFLFRKLNHDSDILKFLEFTRMSMTSNRRLQPIPQDWAYALARLHIKSSELSPHLELPSAPEITQPTLALYPPDPPLNPQPELFLGPELTGLAVRQKYVPSHLPPIPSKHTWKHTDIYPKREEDARKIREIAQAEGVMAEQAMRKLMASGAHAKASKKDRRSPKDQLVWDKAMKAVLEVDEKQKLREEAAAALEWETDGVRAGPDSNGSQVPDIDSTMLVNYEERFWRPTPQKRKRS